MQILSKDKGTTRELETVLLTNIKKTEKNCYTISPEAKNSWPRALWRQTEEKGKTALWSDQSVTIFTVYSALKQRV